MPLWVSPALLRCVMFAVFFAAALLAGRLTRLPETGMALIVPAIGVGMLWLLPLRSRALLGQGLVLAVISAALLYLTQGGSGWSVVWIGLCHFIDASVSVLLLRRLSGPGPVQLRTPEELGRLTAATAGGAAVATVAVSPVLVAGTNSLELNLLWLLAWFCRAVAGSLLALILWAVFTSPGARAGLRGDLGRREFGALLVVLMLVHGVAFGWSQMPLAFSVVPVLAWAGMRFQTATVSLATVISTLTIIGITKYGFGPFAALSPAGQTLYAQFVILVLGGVTLALSLYRNERDAMRATERADSDEMFGHLFEGAPIGAVLTALPEQRHILIQRANGELHAILGVEPGALAGSDLIDQLHPEDVGLLLEALVTPTCGTPLQLRLRAANGDDLVARLRISAIHPRSAGATPSLLLIIEDVTVQYEHQAVLAAQATQDGLTGLGNRRMLTTAIEQAAALEKGLALDGTNRPSSTGTGILFLDLDRFKAVNDTAGHAVGDELLVLVGHRLAGAVREHDVVCRVGGDEFAVVCPQISVTDLTELTQRLLDSVVLPYVLEAGTFTVGASIGVAVARPSEPWSVLLRRADEAMYVAKQSGGASFHVDDDAPSQTAAP